MSHAIYHTRKGRRIMPQTCPKIHATTIHYHASYAVFTVPHATFGPGFDGAADGAAAACASTTGFGGTGNGLLWRVSYTRWACSVFLMNHPAYLRPTVDSAIFTMFCAECQHKRHMTDIFDADLVDYEVEVACRDHLTTEQTLFVLNAADTPARLLHHHQLLNHLFLVGVQEIGQFLGVKGGVQLQEAPQCRYWRLCTDISQEKSKMALSRFDV